MIKWVYSSSLSISFKIFFSQPGKSSTDFDQYITNLLTQDPIEQFCLRTWGSYWKRISPSLISYEFFANEKETERRVAIMKLKTYTNDVCTIKCLSHVLSVMKQVGATVMHLNTCVPFYLYELLSYGWPVLISITVLCVCTALLIHFWVLSG